MSLEQQSLDLSVGERVLNSGSNASTSAASSSTSGQEQNKRKPNPKPFEKGKPPQKYQRNNQNARNPRPQVPRNPNFKKETPSAIISTTPIRRFFTVYVSNLGTQKLGTIVYNTMSSKNAKLTQLIPLDQFIYVINLAFYNRIVTTAGLTGTAFPDGVERLRQVAQTIELPDIICKYIEAIGIVEMANSAKIVPYCMENFTFHCDADYDYTVPIGAIASPHNPWGIDIPTVLAYNEAIARAKPSSINFRLVSGSDVCEGRKEMAVSYKRDRFGILPLSPEKLPEGDAQLGAIYHFRNIAKRLAWKRTSRNICVSLIEPHFQTACIEWELIFAKMCSDSFKGASNI